MFYISYKKQDVMLNITFRMNDQTLQLSFVDGQVDLMLVEDKLGNDHALFALVS